MGESKLKNSRLLIVTPEYPPENWGGLSRTVEKVSGHAALMGMETHVAHLKVVTDRMPLFDENRSYERIPAGKPDAWIHLSRIEVGREDFSDFQRDLWDCPHTLTLRMMSQSLEKLMGENRFDLLHSFFLYPMGYVTGMLASRKRIPHVTTLVGNDVKKYMFSPEKLATCLSGLANSDHVVGLSNDLLDIADSVESVWHKGSVIYNSVSIPNAQWKEGGQKSERFKVGCAGIFKYAKGLPYLLKAVSILNESGERVELELLGELRPGEEKVLAEVSNRCGLGRAPVIKGPVPHEMITSWLLTLDCFVMPSVSEGCPNILMEALAAGLPCVATRTGAAEDLILDGVSGRLTDWGDSGALSEAVREIMENPEKALSMGRAARSRMELFSAQRERDAWKDLYTGLLENGPGRGKA